MKALDLFCGAGGVSEGLRRAGFEVTGVDINPQPHYRGGVFVQADAMTFPLEGYDLIWASPPCQAFTAYRRRPEHVRPRENLIPGVRERLQAQGAHWAIENVPGAPLRRDLLLCGSMFGLDVRRHRISRPPSRSRSPPAGTASSPRAFRRRRTGGTSGGPSRWGCGASPFRCSRERWGSPG